MDYQADHHITSKKYCSKDNEIVMVQYYLSDDLIHNTVIFLVKKGIKMPQKVLRVKQILVRK